MSPLNTATDIQRETLDLAKQLVACRSVTPDDGGCLQVLAARLETAGFVCERLDRGGVRNLWARFGSGRPIVCLAGHVDVVPPGPLNEWASEPFTPTERDGFLYGRGASDMKGPLAAMVTAAERVAASTPERGSIAVLVTSDEEGAAVDGTAFVVESLRARGDTIDACIIGEPTSVDRLGDTIKNGRRGSLGGELRVKGVQCHIAYPERGLNPIHAGLPALAELAAVEWDRGNMHFQPTSFQISNVHAGTGAANVIPGVLEVSFNVRFSPELTVENIQTRVREVLDRHGIDYDVTWSLTGRPFLTKSGPLVEILSQVIKAVTGREPELSTGGGTSDGRFLAAISAEVVEFGPPNESIHKVNERIAVADIAALSIIYERTIARLIAPNPS
jgi:succinyl-diaminopimelate desuccinylase